MEEKNEKLKEIFLFLKEKGLIVDLIRRANVSRTTVVLTFENQFENLKGKQLKVFTEALKMIDEINELEKRADKALAEK